MADLELIGVPFDGYGRLGHQARAPMALRAAGLPHAMGSHVIESASDLELPSPDPTRGPATTFVNEAALLAMTEALNARVGRAIAARRFPVVYGGDCATLLGIVTGLRDHVPGTGLIFVDGHEDTMPLDVSEDGEAANAEIGLLLGMTGRTLRGPLASRLPALSRDQIAVIGPRDEAWRRQFNVGTLADTGVWLAPLAATAAGPFDVGRGAVAALARRCSRWWLHVDLDVLEPAEFPAQGLPDVPDDPGGLTWPQLTELTTSVVGAGGCLGFSIAIYDPDQDPESRCAADIVRFVATTLAAL